MRYDQEQVARFRNARAWLDRTLADDAEARVATTPDALAFLGEDRDCSYAALYREAEAIGSALSRLGVRQGEVISFMIPNWPEAAAINLAASLMGFVINPIVPIYREAETRAILSDCESRALFIPTTFRGFDYPAMIRGLLPALPALRHVITVRGNEDGLLGYDMLVGEPGQASRPKVDPDSVKLVLYTSGTTGRAKAVLHSHNTLVRSVWASAEYWGTRPGDRFIMPSPVTHITGYSNGLERPFVEGTQTVLMESWNADRAVELVDLHHVTATVGATPFLIELAQAAQRAGTKLSSLRIFACGGAAVPGEVIRFANGVFANACASRVYGSSEAPFVSLGFFGSGNEEKAANSDGFVYDYEVRVIDEHGVILPPGEDGEILVRGPALFLGYGEDAQTCEAFDADGFFRTGDIGHVSPDGAITLTSRKKDLIIRGGENISAKEIEDVLHRHPDVIEAAVVAMPHARLGEGICAFLRTRDDASLGLVDFTAILVESGLARQKYPERYETLPDFPRTPSGKIRKDQLRTRIEEIVARETSAADENA